MRQIRWTTEAADQLEAAIRRIQQDNPDAGQRTAQLVIDRIEQLATFPAVGRLGEVDGTRELVIKPYVIVYRATGEIVQILQVWHGAQDWR